MVRGSPLVSFAAVALAAVICAASSGCGAANVPPSNSVKLGEALAFAGVAAAAQVAQSVMEQRARNNVPIRHTGVSASPNCDNEGQYPCVSLTASSGDPRPPEEEMSIDEAREYVLGYVNGVRKLNDVEPLASDPAVDVFAQAGSDELAKDHRQGQHVTDHARELPAFGAEVQGSPQGSSGGLLQDQLGQTLIGWMNEGQGGMHHDILLRHEWRKLGVGIAQRDGRTYFTIDFSR
jgi:uncharacterized protein YkwD